MALSDIDRLRPYRVQWRPNLVTSFVLIADVEKHEEAFELREAKLKEFGGQARVVVQHIIGTKGLGASD